MLIAVILNNTQTNFSNDIIAAIQAETDKAGYQMFILYAGNHNARLLNQAISVALERHVAGILLVATSSTNKLLAPYKKAIPLVG